MSDKPKRYGVKFRTPRGPFIWPKLNTPDTKWKAEGQYSTKQRLTPEDVENGIPVEKINEMLDEFFADKKAELAAGDKKSQKKASTLTKKVFEVKPEEDKDGEETGNFVINPKMTASGVSKTTKKPWTRKPQVFDAKGKELTKVPLIFGGSEGKLACEAVPYYTPKDNECGVTIRLDAVQVLKLVKGGQKDAAGHGFGEEEGYSGADDEDVGGKPFDDESDDGGDNKPSDDDEDF